MVNLKNAVGSVVLSVVAIANVAISSEIGVLQKQPQITVQASDYIAMQNTAVAATTLKGRFTVLGEGIYGHFDVIAYDDSGKVVQRITTENYAYRKDHGSRIKTISIDIGSKQPPAKIEVSFHEMRSNPQTGACVVK